MESHKQHREIAMYAYLCLFLQMKQILSILFLSLIFILYSVPGFKDLQTARYFSVNLCGVISEDPPSENTNKSHYFDLDRENSYNIYPFKSLQN